MNLGYFEQMHRDERRRSEWKSLDEALTQRTGSSSKEVASLRMVVGHVLIQAGSKLIREQVQADLHRQTKDVG